MELEELKYLDLIRNKHNKGDYLVSVFSKIVFMTSTHCAMNHGRYKEEGFEYSSVIFEESGQILDIQ